MTTILDPLQDGKSQIQLIDSMGGDLSVVNDAKASFNRMATKMGEKETKLINYLIKHNHSSPLRGVVFKFKVNAPLYICRQWWKHCLASNHNDEQIGWNEQSFRYTEISDSGDFYVPTEFKKQSKSNKQGSDGTFAASEGQLLTSVYHQQCSLSFQAYQTLIEKGVSREQARGILVPSVYTSWVWTVSLQSVLNFIDLRLGAGAQNEITAYAEAIKTLIEPIVPITIQAWAQNNEKNYKKTNEN